MMGMEMMLKAMGLDPAALKTQLEDHIAQVTAYAKATIIHFNSRFTAHEAHLVRVEAKIDLLLKHVGVEEIDAAISNQLVLEGIKENVEH